MVRLLEDCSSTSFAGVVGGASSSVWVELETTLLCLGTGRTSLILVGTGTSTTAGVSFEDLLVGFLPLGRACPFLLAC